MTEVSNYTDVDLHEGIIALRRRAGLPISDLVEAVLDAVAPAIAARALREAARTLHDRTEGPDRIGTAAWPEHRRDAYTLAIEESCDVLTSTADEIEADQ